MHALNTTRNLPDRMNVPDTPSSCHGHGPGVLKSSGVEIRSTLFGRDAVGRASTFVRDYPSAASAVCGLNDTRSRSR